LTQPARRRLRLRLRKRPNPTHRQRRLTDNTDITNRVMSEIAN
jgi:hypothetical protein